MPDHLARARLRDALVSLFSDKDAIRLVTADAGFRDGQFDLGGRPVDVWHRVLEEALKQSKVRALTDAARRAYPRHSELRDAAKPLRDAEAEREAAEAQDGGGATPWPSTSHRKLAAWAGVFVLVAFAASYLRDERPRPHTYEGTVFSDGRPVTAATVIVHGVGCSARTDANGHFRLACPDAVRLLRSPRGNLIFDGGAGVEIELSPSGSMNYTIGVDGGVQWILAFDSNRDGRHPWRPVVVDDAGVADSAATNIPLR